MNDDNPPPPLWYRILILLEGFLKRVVQRLEHTLEFADWVVAGFLGFLSYVIMVPIRRLMGSRIVESTQKAQDDLAEGTAGLLIRLRDFMADMLPRIFPPRCFWPCYMLFDKAAWFLDFLLAWYFTRDFKKLLWSIPAIMLSVPLLGALILGTQYSSEQKILHYDIARREALREEDRERADFLLTRLLQLGFKNEERAKYENALALISEDKTDEGLSILKEMAPLKEISADESRFAAAHIYLAAALMDGTIKDDNPWPLIRKHVDYALEMEPNQPLAKRFLIECQLHNQEYDAAITGMESMRKIFPDFNAELAHRYAQRGDAILAKIRARAAVEYFERLQRELAEQAEDDADGQAELLQLTPQGYLRVAGAFAIDGQPERELELLREGAELYAESEMNQRAYAARLSREIGEFRFSNLQKRDYLKQLLIADPAHSEGLRLLFLPITAGDAEAEAVASELVEDPRTPAKLLKAIGDMYLTTEQMAKAKRAYQLACDKDVQSAYAWNNLAWIWSNVQPIDLEMALRCTDQALKAKQDPNFFETRGQILVKLERWEEAAGFLERAINGSIPNPQDAHRSLASVYTAMGKPEQAAAHRAASGQ